MVNYLKTPTFHLYGICQDRLAVPARQWQKERVRNISGSALYSYTLPYLGPRYGNVMHGTVSTATSAMVPDDGFPRR